LFRRDVHLRPLERSTDAIANTGCTLITISRSISNCSSTSIATSRTGALVGCALVVGAAAVTNDNLRSFLAMSMF